jgi:hypothetical protein
VRVLSPVDGTVIEARGEGAGFTLRVDPDGLVDLRHLLSGAEVRAWALRELERRQRALGPGELGAALADGGELVTDVGATLPRDRYDALLGDMLLELVAAGGWAPSPAGRTCRPGEAAVVVR